jgi:hypothetical protein
MKTTKLLLLLLGAALTMISCKKDAATPFAGTTYTDLSAYDNTGKPTTGLLHDNISDSLLAFIDSLLPESKNLTLSHPELFSSSAIADISVTQASDVYVTFVKQGGIWNNALAFYTYSTSQPPASAKDIKNIIYFFPNVGHLSTLTPGDKVKIGSFTSGTSIGFVLMQNAWDSTKATLNNDAVHFCTNDVLNPETDVTKKKHAVIIPYNPESKVLVGFEDFNRMDPACDNDFNDVLFYCTIVHS